ncbi:porin family protein [Thiotrichales bacterium 19S3-7]|nr:porin family protein [Thiotrichales bacterium 19S3-7]MCF6802401.1 porin family protein [Thiotrichales bacterium 19S3-11]
MNFKLAPFMYLCISLALTSNQFAYANEQSNRQSKPSISLLPEFGYYRYEEPGIMEIKGPLIGLSSETKIPFTHKLSFRLFVRGAYNFGSYSSTNTGDNDNDNSWLINIAPSVGYSFVVNHNVTMTPYTGVGYRYLNNDSSGNETTTGHFGYLRESNYFYWPIGIDLIFRHKKWTYRGVFEYDYLIVGYQYSHLPASFGGTISNKQTNGYGLNGKLEISYDVSHSVQIGIGPYIRYWNIKESEVDNGYVEPDNNTFEAGGFISFLFS